MELLLTNVKRQAGHYPKYLETTKHGHTDLTDAENRVLLCMATGMSNQEIADALQVSLATVKSHAGKIYVKLNVKNRTAAVQLAKEVELI